ncbi:hypothetical protein [Hyphobacterium sp.]|uniref:hypothetical protein n=1 Tax=Hyphobacterium sp. TaxID=2004662 RepID=UPI003B521625
MMKSFAKLISAAGFFSLAALAAPTAMAGTWHLDAASCPDLREDRRDARYNHGRFDRREDRRDRRVINCPPRSWSYVADRYERRHGLQRGTGARRGTPGTVYTNRAGEFWRVNRRGRAIPLDVVVHYGHGTGRYGRWNRPHRGRHGYGSRPRRYSY